MVELVYIPGKSLVLNVADGDLVTWGLLVAFTVLLDVVTASGDLPVVDFCGIFDLVTTMGSGKLPWLRRSLGISFLLTLSTDEGKLASWILLVGEVVLKDCAVGMLAIGRWLESDSESV